MRKPSGSAIAVLTAILAVSMAVPAVAAQRIRIYRGETSDAKPIGFFILKAEDGRRFFKGFEIEMTMTCEDGSTQSWGMGSYWGGRYFPLTDGVLLDIDENTGYDALHIHGRIGQRRGSGTFSYTVAALTPDEQAQVCTTGELTWQVEYDETRSGPGLPFRDRSSSAAACPISWASRAAANSWTCWNLPESSAQR